MTWTSFGNGLYTYNSNTDTQITTGITTGSGLFDLYTNNKYLFTGGTWVLIAGGGGGATNLDGLTDVDTTTVAPTNNQVLTYNTAGTKWVPATPPGATGGEANTYSSVGTGLAWTLSKTGVNLPFRSLIAGSNKLSATANTNDITIDVAEANLTLANIGGTIGNAKIADLVYSKLTSVPSSFTPSVHASSHNLAGGDIVHIDTIGAGTDITTNNASTAKHGLLKKLSNAATDYMDGTGNWSVPPSSGGGGITASSIDTLSNKTIDADINTLTNIENADIKPSAGIVTTKLADSTNFVLTTRTNSFGDFNNTFKDNRLLINNPTDTFAYTIIGAAIAAARSVTLPLLIGNDTFVTEAFAQALTNKTINADSNTITNIENADIKTAAGIVYSKLNLTGTILDADVNTSAAIATSKLADNTNFILKTLDNAFGAHYHDITKMTAPSNPSANDIRLYVDTTDTHMKIKNSAGTVVDLHTGGGGGAPTGAAGGDLTGTYPNPTITAAAVCTSKLGDDCVTLQKLQNLTDQRLIGRSAGSAGDPQELSSYGNDFTFDTTNAKIGVNNYDVFKQKIEYFEDCMSAVANGTSGTGFVAQESSGTGSTLSNVAVSETGVFGVFDCQTGTTATGFSVLYSGQAGRPAFLLGQGITIMEAKIKIPVLSTSSERFKVVIGFTGDCDIPTINDGVYFEYIDNLSSGAWRYCTSNDGTRTETSSGTTVVADTWYRFKIVINAAASSVDFLLNGSVVGTITTNIPSGTGDPVGVIAGLWKTVGTTTRSLYIDYMAMSLRLTTIRA